MKEESLIKNLYGHFDELSFGFRASDRKYDCYNNMKIEAYEKLIGQLPDDFANEMLLDEGRNY